MCVIPSRRNRPRPPAACQSVNGFRTRGRENRSWRNWPTRQCSQLHRRSGVFAAYCVEWKITRETYRSEKWTRQLYSSSSSWCWRSAAADSSTAVECESHYQRISPLKGVRRPQLALWNSGGCWCWGSKGVFGRGDAMHAVKIAVLVLIVAGRLGWHTGVSASHYGDRNVPFVGRPDDHAARS
jgi:hypothetical protein